MKTLKTMVIATIATLVVVIGIVLGIHIYYMNRWYSNTWIGDREVSGMTYEESAELINRVFSTYQLKITGRNTETGIVNTLADRAFLKNKDKKVEMSGNVVSYQGDTKIEADKGVYDIKTQQLHGEGNIRFKYNINSNKGKEKEN